MNYWYTGCYSPYNHVTTYFKAVINIMKDVEFTQVNKMFEVVCRSYYKHGSSKPHHKKGIEAGDMAKLNSNELSR